MQFNRNSCDVVRITFVKTIYDKWDIKKANKIKNMDIILSRQSVNFFARVVLNFGVKVIWPRILTNFQESKQFFNSIPKLNIFQLYFPDFF